MKKISTKQLVSMGLLIAMDIVLNRFLSIKTDSLSIGLDFIPMVVAAMLYGPIAAATVHGLADIIGAIAIPRGAYFPGFTVSAVLMGLVFGLLLYKKERSFWRMCLAVGISQYVIALFITSFWLTIYLGSFYWVQVTTRIVQIVVVSAAQIVVVPILGQLVNRLDKALKLREA